MFSNRTDAGLRLADRLGHLQGHDPVVVGLPRGGVPVAYHVAHTLDAPLDVILVRKLGVPHQPELAMGAIGEDGVRVIADDIVAMARVTNAELAQVESRERIELDRRANLYRAGRKRIPLGGRVVIVVDDGVATGSTAKAACQVARQEGAHRVILAVPVAPIDWTHRLVGVADELIALDTPEYFFGIGQFYRDFSATSDEEVIACLDVANKQTTASAAHNPGTQGIDPPVRDDDVAVKAANVTLRGHLRIPEHATGVVIFAHGSGSSRHSPRNRYVASTLNDAGLATLLFDLLSETEETERTNVFDIELLTRRLIDVTQWVRHEPDLAGMEIGYFGASTGAAAALSAAAQSPTNVSAVVSRGGRPDLAGPRLGHVQAPTLLIVGGDDDVVLALNRQAQTQMNCPTTLHVIPGATHLFEEPGTLQTAAEQAATWLLEHLPNHSSTTNPS